MRLNRITSRSNPRLKAIKKIQKAGNSATAIVVEGEKLVREAFAGGLLPQSAFVTQEADLPQGLNCPSYLLPESVYSSISPTKSGRSPLVVFSKPEMSHWPGEKSIGSWLLLDQLQDPGNAGTLVRAAVAFGFEGVFWHQPSVYPFHHSCIRASAGMIFHIQHRLLVTEDIPKLNLPLIIGELDGQQVATFSWPERMILAMGNEGHGFSSAIKQQVTATVSIPMAENTESLNVAGAGHILMYQFSVSHQPG